MKLPLDQIERIRELGYTDSEARFLYIVAVHSGYFTLRQFLNFVGSISGKRSRGFSQKVINRGHVRVREYLGAGVVFHVFSQTLYGLIDTDNLGNRLRHSFDFIRTRLALLDFILANQSLDYLETEQDKVKFFCEELHIRKEFFPAKLYRGRTAGPPAVRYFQDKFPLFVASPVPGEPPVVTFSFVDSGAGSLRAFVTHLETYQSLFRQLAAFRFLYIACKEVHFRMAEKRFRALVNRPLESDVSGEIVRYFEIRKKWENHEYVVPKIQDFEFLNEARSRFQGEPFEDLYGRWLRGEMNELELLREFLKAPPERTISFDTYLVKQDRALTAENEQTRVTIA
jgi:hypothetical protein